MPPFAGFSHVGHYIRLRLRQHNLTQVEFAKRMGWGRSYLRFVIDGEFFPSPGRCDKISRYFGDDPSLLRTLAGHALPPADPRERTLREIAALVQALDLKQRRKVLKFIKSL